MNVPVLLSIALLIVLLIIWSAAPAAITTESFATINKTRVVTFHYVNWCPACALMRVAWERVVAQLRHRHGIQFIELDEDIAKTAGINGYPTIRMVTDTGRVLEYGGGPDIDALRVWIMSPRPV